ncbi:defective proboscis extension response [Culex quinquefasciatus]|uniref:Defective proboscis extension response n=1 Tax=Culex quinquefasciatus TaxID=7176 RepID=B0WK33_CULQU|nr:defective proboscis extension response [Culex quinquefasciatus]|eukprot:XP_001849067.1 defective proboscis extension response [Culex quinquefasciatus]
MEHKLLSDLLLRRVFSPVSVCVFAPVAEMFMQSSALLCTKACELVGSSRKFRTDFLQEWPTPGTGPYFDTASIPSNITGLVGKTVLLVCKVKNLGNRTVSWVRHRDIHLLTVGRYTYTSDQRFEAMHSPHTEEWTLRIRYAQRKDSGIYECQISTTPPIGHFVYLTVVSWVRHRDIHLLTVGRYTYTSDQRFEAMHSPHTEEWTLRIRYAQRKDSGIYECQISTTPPIGHFVYLTVVGEHPAAMHHGMSTILAGPSLVVFVLTTLLLYYHHSIRWKHLLT